MCVGPGLQNFGNTMKMRVYSALHILCLLTAALHVVVCEDSADSISDEEFDPELVEEIIQEYNSAFAQDLKKVPPENLHEALKKAIPDLKIRMTAYSQNLFSSSVKEARKPNPMLMGFAMGLKSWAEGLSGILPLLYTQVHISTHQLEQGSLCWLDEDEEVCCEEDEQPCCNQTDVCCPDDFLWDVVY